MFHIVDTVYTLSDYDANKKLRQIAKQLKACSMVSENASDFSIIKEYILHDSYNI